MDWGVEPYWWRGSQQVGPAFIRSFPRLETFTLVVIISRWAWQDGEKEMLVAIVKKHTAAQFEIEQSLHPEWRMPIINFHRRKDSIDRRKTAAILSIVSLSEPFTRMLNESFAGRVSET
jgi:hypothetical protein